MVDVAPRRRRGKVVELLLHLQHVEGGHPEDLGLAALEQRRAVDAGKDAGLSRDRADLHGRAPVHANALREHVMAHGLLERGVDGGRNRRFLLGERLLELFDDGLRQLVEGLVALGLRHDAEDRREASGDFLFDGLILLVRVIREEREISDGLSALFHELGLRLAQRADDGFGRFHARGHFGFSRLGAAGLDDGVRVFGGLGLDHHDGDVVAHDAAGDRHGERRPLELAPPRKGNPLPVD